MPAFIKRFRNHLLLVALVPLLSFFIGLGENKKSTPIIRFEATTIFFDTIKAGKKITGEFVYKNTGDVPLNILTVQASDGGTIAYWPEQLIMPGAKGKIEVEFGFTETRQGCQDKLFTVLSNAQNNPETLHWKGYIKQ